MSVWSDAVVLQTRGIKNDWEKDVLTSPKEPKCIVIETPQDTVEHIVSSINPQKTKNNCFFDQDFLFFPDSLFQELVSYLGI